MAVEGYTTQEVVLGAIIVLILIGIPLLFVIRKHLKKIHFNIILILTLIVLILGSLYGLGVFDTANMFPHTEKYTNEFIKVSFDYPSDWTLYASTVPNPIIRDPTHNPTSDEIIFKNNLFGKNKFFIKFSKEGSYDSNSYEIAKKIARKDMGYEQGIKLTSESNITVDGVPAYQITITKLPSNLTIRLITPDNKANFNSNSSEAPIQETRIIFFKENREWLLIFTSNNLQSIQSDIDMILKSFHVEESSLLKQAETNTGMPIGYDNMDVSEP